MRQIYSVGKVIRYILDPILGAKRVHVLRANPETPMPYAVYMRTGLSAKDYDKCNSLRPAVVLSVDVYSSKYEEGVHLAERITDAIGGLDINEPIEGLVVEEIELSDAREDVAEDGNIYIQQLEITIQV